DLHERLRNANHTRGVRKPRNPDGCSQAVFLERGREIAQTSVRRYGPSLQLLERRRRTLRRPARILAPQNRQEALLDSDDVPHAPAHLLVVANRRVVPGVEEDRIGPFCLRHLIPQERKHGNTLASWWSSRCYQSVYPPSMTRTAPVM